MDSGSKQFFDLLNFAKGLDLNKSWDQLTTEEKQQLTLLGTFLDWGGNYDTYTHLQTLAKSKQLEKVLDETADTFTQFEKLQSTLPTPEILSEYLNFKELKSLSATSTKESVYEMVKRVQKAYEVTRLAYARRAAIIAEKAVKEHDKTDPEILAKRSLSETEKDLVEIINPKSQTYEKASEAIGDLSNNVVDQTYPQLHENQRRVISQDLSLLFSTGVVDLRSAKEIAIAVKVVESRTGATLQDVDTEKEIEKILPQIEELFSKTDFQDKAIANQISIQKKIQANQPYLEKYKRHEILTDEKIETLVHLSAGALPNLVRPISTQNAITAKEHLKNDPTHPKISPQAAKFYGHMDKDTFLRVLAHAHAHENTALGQFVKHNEEFITHLRTQTETIHDSPLGKELFRPLTGLSKNIYGLTNTINGFLPESVTKFTNVLLHPLDSAKSWVGKKVAEKAAKEVGKIVAEKIGQEGVKRIATTLLSEGLKKGLITLATQVGAALGIDIGLAATGVGIPAAIISLIVQAAIFVGGMILDQVQKNSKKIQEQAIGALFMFSQLISVGIPLATKSIWSVSMGAVFAILVGIAVTFFIYVTSFLMAPIIASIAHIGNDSAISASGDLPYGDLSFDCKDGGKEITIDAGGFPVNKIFMVGPGRSKMCITPSKIVIHWTGTWGNLDAVRRYLETTPFSCQIGTDTDGTVQQWMVLWEKKAELAQCVGGNENNYAVNNEIVGAWFIPPGSDPRLSTNPRDARAPSETSIQSSINTTCYYMQQYKIPSSQIFGHYQLMPGKPDPGEAFLDYFIDRVKKTCG